MDTKKPWMSKTMWVNALAFVAMMVQQSTGQDLVSPEIQAAILALVNLALRLVTRSPVGLS